MFVGVEGTEKVGGQVVTIKQAAQINHRPHYHKVRGIDLGNGA